jgi:hypothetical protein
VPAPDSTQLEIIKKNKAWGSNQKLRLFNLGKAMSVRPTRRGINMLPKPPIRIGITVKKIIIKAWLVTVTLYN